MQGLSPRAGIALVRAAKAVALMAERDYLVPEDVQSVFVPTMAHRLKAVAQAGRGAVEQARAMLQAVAVP